MTAYYTYGYWYSVFQLLDSSDGNYDGISFHLIMEYLNITKSHSLYGAVSIYAYSYPESTSWLKNSHFESNKGFDDSSSTLEIVTLNMMIENSTFVIGYDVNQDYFEFALYFGWCKNLTLTNNEFYSNNIFEDIDANYRSLLRDDKELSFQAKTSTFF